MRIVQCLSHSIEAYDQLRLYTELGYEAVDLGGYIDPRNPHDPKRPALPDAPFFPEVKAAVDALGTPDNLGAAQSYIPDAVLEWLGDDGVIIFHHYLDRLWGQWDHIRDWMRGSPGRRVIWRTVGQSVEHNERTAAPYRRDGLQIVRYSPKERNIPGYAGEDALIRFYKDPDEWSGWTGDGNLVETDGGVQIMAPGRGLDRPFVVNFTQHLRQREPYTNWRFWDEATRGLPRVAAGPGSEVLNGAGEMGLDAMQLMLRVGRAYLYTGTQPASYTLGLIEAMMTGIPVVSIGPSWMTVFPYGPELFEGHEIVRALYGDDPAWANGMLQSLLADHALAKSWGEATRDIAIELFGKATIAAQWKAFLG